MGLLQSLKNNSSTFHIRTKEEIDQLFSELSIQRLPIDNKLDFYIRMSIQKVKLQLYYELKLAEYRRNVNSSKEEKVSDGSSKVAASKNTKKIRPPKSKPKTPLQKEDDLRKNETKEEIIAENREKIAKFHPEPDFDRSSSTIYQSRRKIEFEKEIKERNKNKWVSIISIPMGGRNKKH